MGARARIRIGQRRGLPGALGGARRASPRAMSRSVSGELLGGPQKVNFPGSFFGPRLPLIGQIDDNQIGGKSPGRVLAIVIDLHPGDVF